MNGTDLAHDNYHSHANDVTEEPDEHGAMTAPKDGTRPRHRKSVHLAVGGVLLFVVVLLAVLIPTVIVNNNGSDMNADAVQGSTDQVRYEYYYWNMPVECGSMAHDTTAGLYNFLFRAILPRRRHRELRPFPTIRPMKLVQTIPPPATQP
jgi:hypothetical protein